MKKRYQGEMVRQVSPETKNPYREVRRASIGNLGEIVIFETGFRFSKGFRLVFEAKNGSPSIDFANLTDTFGVDVTPKYLGGLHWAAADELEIVMLPPVEDAFKDPRDILIFLHELGHLSVVKKTGQPGPNYFSVEPGLEAKIAYETLRVKNERQAWDEALLAARRIRDLTRIDFLSLFKDDDELETWIWDSKLETYERNLEALGIPAFSKVKKVAEHKEEKMK